MDKKLHTLRMLAERLKPFGLTQAWLKAEAEAGRIPCFRAGRRMLFDPEAVEQALLQRARQTEKGGAHV
jgi:hypothetical protein